MGTANKPGSACHIPDTICSLQARFKDPMYRNVMSGNAPSHEATHTSSGAGANKASKAPKRRQKGCLHLVGWHSQSTPIRQEVPTLYPSFGEHFEMTTCRCGGKKPDGKPCTMTGMFKCRVCPLTKVPELRQDFSGWSNPLASNGTKSEIIDSAKMHVNGNRGWHSFWDGTHQLYLYETEAVPCDVTRMKKYLHRKAPEYQKFRQDFEKAGLLEPGGIGQEYGIVDKFRMADQLLKLYPYMLVPQKKRKSGDTQDTSEDTSGMQPTAHSLKRLKPKHNPVQGQTAAVSSGLLTPAEEATGSNPSASCPTLAPSSQGVEHRQPLGTKLPPIRAVISGALAARVQDKSPVAPTQAASTGGGAGLQVPGLEPLCAKSLQTLLVSEGRDQLENSQYNSNLVFLVTKLLETMLGMPGHYPLSVTSLQNQLASEVRSELERSQETLNFVCSMSKRLETMVRMPGHDPLSRTSLQTLLVSEVRAKLKRSRETSNLVFFVCKLLQTMD